MLNVKNDWNSNNMIYELYCSVSCIIILSVKVAFSKALI